MSSPNGIGHRIDLGAESPWAIWRLCAVRSPGFPADLAGALRQPGLAEAADSHDIDADAFKGAYLEGWQRISDRLASLAREPRLREAIIWQNPQMIDVCLDPVATAPGFAGRVPPKAHRRRLEKVASYLQRYTLKNDTIGFFGPVGWAWWDGDRQDMTVSPGPELLSRRRVYFETWAVDALARALTADPELRASLPLRRSPEMLLGNDYVLTPTGRRIELSRAENLAMGECDGIATMDQVVARVRRKMSEPDGAVVVDAVTRLCRRGFVHAEPYIPCGAHPEQVLRELLTTMPASAARSRTLHALDRITEGAEAVSAAAGKPDELACAMAHLNETFTEITGDEASRRHGQTYAGRTILYEDTVRDVDIRLGRRLRMDLSPALELVLTSARWLTWAVGQAYEQRLRRLFEAMRKRAGGAEVPLGKLMSALTPELVFSRNGLPPLVASRTAELQRRWADLLAIPDGIARHDINSVDIRDAALRAFACPGAPWSAAMQHSPDIMLAADGVDAINAGDYLAVLAELHVGVNTLQSRVFVEQSPDPAGLMADDAADHRTGRVVALPAKQSQGVNSRTYPSALLSPAYTYWAMYPDVADRPAEPLPAAALHVSDLDGRLTVTSRIDGRQFDPLEMLSEPLRWTLMNGFSPIGWSSGQPATRPRVTIDSLVLARQAWNFTASRLDWASSRDGADRYRTARRWREISGLPERCFYRLPLEDKPQLVDFTSILLVDLLAKGLRRQSAADPTATVSFSEVLPDVDQTWLVDRLGHRYSCELRMVAVDRRGTTEAEKEKP